MLDARRHHPPHSLTEIRVRIFDKATAAATAKIKWNLCSLVVVDGMAAL
jgi:hypothetical protein